MNFTKRNYGNFTNVDVNPDQSTDNTNEILNRYNTNGNKADLSLYDSSVEIGRSSTKNQYRFKDILDDEATKESHYGHKIDHKRSREKPTYNNSRAKEPASILSNKYASKHFDHSFERDVDQFLNKNGTSPTYSKEKSTYLSDPTSGNKTELLIHETHKIIERLPSLNDNLNNLLSSSIDRIIFELKTLKDENIQLRDKVNYISARASDSSNESIQNLSRENEKLIKVNETFKSKLAKYKDLYDDSKKEIVTLQEKVEYLNSCLNQSTANKTQTVNAHNELLDKIEQLQFKVGTMESHKFGKLNLETQKNHMEQNSPDFHVTDQSKFQQYQNTHTTEPSQSGIVLNNQNNKLEQEFEKLQNQLNNFRSSFQESQSVVTPKEETLDVKFSKLREEFERLQQQSHQDGRNHSQEGSDNKSNSRTKSETTMEDLKNEILGLKDELKNQTKAQKEDISKKKVSFEDVQTELRSSHSHQNKEGVDILHTLLTDNKGLYETMIRLLNRMDQKDKYSIQPCSICTRGLCNHSKNSNRQFFKSSANPPTKQQNIKIIIDELINKKNARLSKELNQELNSLIPNLMKQMEISKLKALLQDDEDYQSNFENESSLLDDLNNTNDLLGDNKRSTGLKENDTISILGEHEWML